MEPTSRSSERSKDSGGDELMDALTLINEWTPTSDVFALKRYMYATSLLSSGSAAYFNAYYRKVVRLRNQAFITTFLPVVILPSLAGSLLHHQFVQRPLLLQEIQCPVCLELRGGMLQMFSGVVYPMLLAPIAAFQYAVRLYTYSMPDITTPRLWFKEYCKLTKPILSKIYFLAGLQIVAGMAWTHWEGHNLLTVMSKLAHMEEVVERHKQKSKNQVIGE
ncbi:hypothetical protein Pcinc_008243 [Petrolisthes cinctipes]|uniref:Transmembrane protein n=1 Tax=Petrolisthes cinctipes TaxID=88211 RepID=A0AAE1GDM9_PETCI|nr:hypothetical protein Pcinc_008243 [Petrolisthes cinctipes]